MDVRFFALRKTEVTLKYVHVCDTVTLQFIQKNQHITQSVLKIHLDRLRFCRNNTFHLVQHK